MNKNLHKTIINRNTGLIVVVAENKMAVFSFSGSLKNNFDASQVQSEIDLGVEVMQDFSRNVQDLNRRKNIELDELKEELKAGKKTQEEYDQAVKKIETEKVIINMVAGGLMSPSDSALGIATSTVSPAVSYAVGQHFKKEGKEGSFEHIATHAVIGALTSAANGGNALSGAVSAGGAEYIAQVTAQTLFKKDAKDLTADEKQTVSSIAQLVGVVSGSVTGDSSVNAYIGNLNAENAVNNNFLTPEDRTRYNELTQKILKGTATDKEKQEWIKKAKFDQMTEELLRRHWRGEELSTTERQTLRQALREVYGKDASGVYKGEIDNYLGVANFYPWGMPDEYKDFYNQQIKESNKMRPLRNDENLLEYGLAYLQNSREMNDYEKAYNNLLKDKSFKEDSLEYAVAKGTAPAYTAAIIYYTNPLGLTGFSAKTIPGIYAQSVGESVLISHAIAMGTGNSYSGYDAFSDVTIGGGGGLATVKAVKYLDDLAKVQVVKNPNTGKWVETTATQGLPTYWKERLSKTGTFVSIPSGMAVSQTLENKITKDNNKKSTTKNDKKITP